MENIRITHCFEPNALPPAITVLHSFLAHSHCKGTENIVCIFNKCTRNCYNPTATCSDGLKTYLTASFPLSAPIHISNCMSVLPAHSQIYLIVVSYVIFHRSVLARWQKGPLMGYKVFYPRIAVLTLAQSAAAENCNNVMVV